MKHRFSVYFSFLFICFCILSYFAFPWYVYSIPSVVNTFPYKLWLDLQGGVELDYFVDLSEVSKSPWYNKTQEHSIIEGLKSIIDKRVQQLGIYDSTISSANYWGEAHIIVQIPLKGSNLKEDQENIEKAKEAIGKVMRIEFKEKREEVTEKDFEERKQIAQNLLKDIQIGKYDASMIFKKYHDSYENVWYGRKSLSQKELQNILWHTGASLSLGVYPEIITHTGILSLVNDTAITGTWVYGILVFHAFSWNMVDTSYGLVGKYPSFRKLATDAQGRVLNEKYFVKASVQINNAFLPEIELTFNDEGKEVFWDITTRLKGKQLAIFVWGVLLTDPVVEEPIVTGKASIRWRFTVEEAKKLANDINMGVVPAPIYLSSERNIDAKLWIDSLELLVISWIAWYLLIVLFLLSIYRLSWFFASLALASYIVIILSLVKLLWITLTLASVAWLVLSIGIAIDANILIFERIKENLKNKKDLLEAFEKGFSDSWSAIWDSNITGLVVAGILYFFWINMIKWFWLMLAIGILISLFSAWFISKMLLWLYIRSKKQVSLKTFIGITG